MPNDQRGPFTIPSGKLRLRGIDYTFPASQQGGVLLDDAAGNLSWGQHAGPFNALINGDFAFAQTGLTSNPLVNGQRNLDEWEWFQNGDGVLYQTAVASGAATVFGNVNLASYSYINVITARTTNAANDYYLLRQYIEGWDARHLVNGSAFSGWMHATTGGIYCFSIRTAGTTYSYVREVPLVANTWTYVTLTFPALANIGGNFRENWGMLLDLCLGTGATFQTSPNAWVAGNYWATGNQVNFAAAPGAQIYMHAWNLIPGQVPQPYTPIPYSNALMRVMRHRQVYGGSVTNQPVGIGQANNANGAVVDIHLPVPLLGVPAFTLSAAGDWRLISNNGSQLLCTSITLPLAAGQDTRVQEMNVLVSGGLVGGDATRMEAVNTNARMIFEAYPT